MGVLTEFAAVVALPLAITAHQNVFGTSEPPIFSDLNSPGKSVMRFTGAAVIFIVGVAFVLVAFGPYLSTACGPKDEQKAVPKTTKESEPSAASGCEKEIRDKAIREALAKPIDFDFVDTPLEEVAKFIGEKAKVNVVLAVRKLEEIALTPETPVTKELQGVSLRAALRVLLTDLELTYVIRDECLIITTFDDANSQLTLRIYDCRDILAMRNPLMGQSRESANLDTDKLQNPATPASTGDATPDRSPPLGRATSARLYGSLRVDQLSGVILSNIGPDSWENAGGPGSIQEYEGLFVISTTPEVHEQVERLLNLFHCAGGLKQPKIKVYE